MRTTTIGGRPAARDRAELLGAFGALLGVLAAATGAAGLPTRLVQWGDRAALLVLLTAAAILLRATQAGMAGTDGRTYLGDVPTAMMCGLAALVLVTYLLAAVFVTPAPGADVLALAAWTALGVSATTQPALTPHAPATDARPRPLPADNPAPATR